MASIWDRVVDQDRAVDLLRRAAQVPTHAYLFVGPPGSTKREAARSFAALLLTGSESGSGRDAELALRGEHPDVREVVRAGAAIAAEQAREIVRTAALAPSEGSRKVMILDEFHLLRPEGAALLLKTIEEPPPSTIFIVLADFVPHDLVTISSRCARVDFRSVGAAAIAAQLEREGVEAARAADAAAAAAGNLDRARVLVSDPALAERRDAFARVAYRLDGSGATVMSLVDELLSSIDEAAAPMSQRHAAELSELEERIARYGERGSGRKAVEERHKRELRRHRTDELLAGLAEIAGAYRDALVARTAPDRAAATAAVASIHTVIEAFERNPNEALLLQAALWQLPVLAASTPR